MGGAASPDGYGANSCAEVADSMPGQRETPIATPAPTTADNTQNNNVFFTADLLRICAKSYHTRHGPFRRDEHVGRAICGLHPAVFRFFRGRPRSRKSFSRPITFPGGAGQDRCNAHSPNRKAAAISSRLRGLIQSPQLCKSTNFSKCRKRLLLLKDRSRLSPIPFIELQPSGKLLSGNA
jgi:hypothetical protein